MATSAPAQINFVSNLLTSKIFLAQVVTLAAMIASAAGYRVIDTPGAQEQLVGILDVLATVLLRWLFPTGPVSLTAPVVTPAAVPVPAGASVVTVPAPSDPIQATAVKTLPPDSAHLVEVAKPGPAALPIVSITPASSL